MTLLDETLADPYATWAQSIGEAEAALVGCLLTMQQTVGVALAHELGAQHFFDEGLGTIWSRIRDVTMRGDVADIR